MITLANKVRVLMVDWNAANSPPYHYMATESFMQAQTLDLLNLMLYIKFRHSNIIIAYNI